MKFTRSTNSHGSVENYPEIHPPKKRETLLRVYFGIFWAGLLGINTTWKGTVFGALGILDMQPIFHFHLREQKINQLHRCAAFFPRYQRHRLSNATSDHGSNSAHLRPALKRGNLSCKDIFLKVRRVCLQLPADGRLFLWWQKKPIGHFPDWK